MKRRHNDPNSIQPPLSAAARGSDAVIEDLIRACGAGMNWMEQVSRANLGSATRGILTVDMGMCSTAIRQARLHLENTKPQPNDGTHAPPTKTL